MISRTAIALAVILAGTQTAMAAETSYVGKSTSMYKKDIYTTAPAGFSLIATAPLPDKYSSRKNFLTITVMIQARCPTDLLATTLNVGGVLPEPDPNASNFTECDSAPGFQMLSRTWTLVPESLGGAPVPDGSSIAVTLYSQSGTANYNLVTVTAVATK
jgi:hypothetical protein